MKKMILFIGVVFVVLLQAKNVSVKNFSSIIDFKKISGKTVSICGNNNIQLTKKSLSKNFIFGKPAKGYLITDLISYDEYWQILKTKNLIEAKSELKVRLNDAQLWIATREGVESLGSPANVEFPFTATVKDCLDGAKTTLGNNCAGSESCCAEKFVGPVITWKEQFRLGYSPDPSVRLKISGDSQPRYCEIRDIINL